MRLTLSLCVSLVATALLVGAAHTQDVRDLPNPYRAIENHFKLAEGRWWGSTAAVDVDIDGESIWVAERCAGNDCASSNLNPILKFDESGNLVKRFGERMFVFPHGIHVDRAGNIWVTDAKGPDGTDPNRAGKGHAVYKFSPDGTLLLTLGKPGLAGDGTGELLNGPSSVVTAANGDVFVADGHGSPQSHAFMDRVARIVKFTKDGKFIKAWGRFGSGPAEFRTPHAAALDSKGRLFVADLGNARIQIFDQDGRFLDEWRHFGRVSGIYIDKHALLYAADSGPSDDLTPGWRRGIRIARVDDGKVRFFIPDPGTKAAGRSGLDGVAVDAKGNVFGAVVGADIPPRALTKFVRQ